MEETFAEAVARRAGADIKTVQSVLSTYNISDSGVVPPARHLRVSRVAFSGLKSIDERESPFDFTWTTDDDGIWGLATDKNFAGKSTVLQVILWALRGTPKSLTKTVAGWLRNVSVQFAVEARRIEVSFRLEHGEPIGTVTVSSEGASQHHPFAGDQAFQAVMQNVMLESLSLDRLAASQKDSEGKVSRYDDGWLSYTGAFLSDSDSNAIIGESHGNDLIQRLLQTFVGVPFGTTLFAARASLNVVRAEANQRRKRLASAGGKNIEELEGEIRETDTRLADSSSRSRLDVDIAAAQRAFDDAQQRLLVLYEARDESSNLIANRREERIRAEQRVNVLQEEHIAANFFARLSPVCCPRCETPVAEERRVAEGADGRCAICATHVAAADQATLEAQRSEAAIALRQAKQREQEAKDASDTVLSRIDDAMAVRRTAADALKKLRELGSDNDVDILERRRARLLGMLEIVKAVAGSDVVDAKVVDILEAASREAEARVVESSKALFDAASTEITRIVKALGMLDVERVVLKRGAQVDVYKGAGISGWGTLAPGEQLRLRIATVIALMRIARQSGSGRHPGLLLIDSPGNEMMEESNLLKALAEMAALAQSDSVQIFVALRGTEQAAAAVPPERLRMAFGSDTLW